MLRLLLSVSAITAMPTTTTTTTTSHKPKKPSTTAANSTTNSTTTTLLCKHSPSATLDLLILILVLFSCTFLITSSLSYIFHSLSLLFSLSLSHLPQSSLPYLLAFLFFFLFAAFVFEIFFCCCCCNYRSRKCHSPACKGLKKAMEFDIQLHTEDCLKSTASKEIDELPWKGGSEGNPDYDCLRSELRKMAPPNGRAVLLFRARCGCPVAKLEAWGAKRGRRHKK